MFKASSIGKTAVCPALFVVVTARFIEFPYATETEIRINTKLEGFCLLSDLGAETFRFSIHTRNIFDEDETDWITVP